MIERRKASNGVVYYASPLLERLGVPHGFSTRLGGKSPPPFDSLNLGNPSGCERQDDYARIYQNFDLFQAACAVASRKRCWVHQVHGGDVIAVRRGQPFENGPKADALVSDDPSRVMSVRVADCVPVLLASDDGKIVAAVHAGWRGVITGIVPAAVEAVCDLAPSPRYTGERVGERGERRGESTDVRLHAQPTPLPRPLPGVPGRGSVVIAALGPGIGFDAFEVGPEVLEQFERTFGSDAPMRRRDDGKGHVDLRAAIQMQLSRAGVPGDRIDTTDHCTFRDADEFFSHRRDHGATGRMAAIIAPAGE